MTRTHIHRLKQVRRTHIVEHLTHQINTRSTRPARKHQHTSRRCGQERAELRLNIRQANRRARLAACRNNRVLHEAAKGITHLTRRRHTKGNDLITRKRATHRNRGIHRQLIKTIRAQECRHTSRYTVTVARQQLATFQLSTSMANISTRCRRLKTLRHIQVMNARLSLQMGAHARMRRTLRTFIQTRMLLTHNRLGTLRDQTTRQNRGRLTRNNRHRQTVNIRARILRIRRSHQTPRRRTRHSIAVHRRRTIVGHRHH